MADYKKGDTASWDTEQVRRSQSGGQQKRPRKKKRRKTPWILKFIGYILFVAITSCILAGVGWMLMNDLCAFNKADITATIEVTADDDMETISTKLQEAGLVEYKWFFQLFGKVAKAEEKIGIGTYELNTDMDYRALIMGMRNASGNMNADDLLEQLPMTADCHVYHPRGLHGGTDPAPAGREGRQHGGEPDQGRTDCGLRL